MDPITLGIIGAGAIIGGGATKAVTGFQASQQQAKGLKRQAGMVEGQAEIDAATRARDARRFASGQMLRASASGVDLGGSPAILTAETLASATAESNAERRQAGQQAQQLRGQARQVQKAGNIGLVTDIVGTVGSLALLGAGFAARPSGPITAGGNVPANLMQPISPQEATTFYGAAPGVGGSQGLTPFQLPPGVRP